MRVSRSGAPLLIVALSSCTTFSNVRSAEINPGLSTTFQGAATTRVGPETGWFWSFDCAQNCGRAIVGGDATLTYASRDNSLRGQRIAVGAGLNGLYPYLEGYVQLARGPRPFGVGARLGLPSDKWFEHQIYTRHGVQSAQLWAEVRAGECSVRHRIAQRHVPPATVGAVATASTATT